MFIEHIHQSQEKVGQLPVRYDQFGFERFENEYGGNSYFELLKQVARKLITSKIEATDQMAAYHCNFDEIMSGLSKIHPFLEVGGAIRTQVPLPRNMEEFHILVDVVLHSNAYKNQLNRFEGDGFCSFKPVNSPTVNLGHGINMLMWNDPGNANQEFNSDYSQSLFILITSVIYQKADIDAYGKRGRYGAETVRRLIDGFAYQIDRQHNTNELIAALVYEEETGFPFGVYVGTYFPPSFSFLDENGATHSRSVGAYSFQLNYTFLVRPASIKIPEGFKLTTLMIAGLLLEAKRVFNCKIEKCYLTIHTDKSAAAKSTAKHLLVSEGEKDNYRAIARKVWSTVINRPLTKFRAGFEPDDFPSMFFADPSTVEVNDPAEEVPGFGDRFYRAIYPEYRKLVQNRTGVTISRNLLNGKLNENEFDVDNKDQFIRELQKRNAFSNRSVEEAPVIDNDKRFHPAWEMNNRHSWGHLNIDWGALGIKKDQKKLEIGMILNRQAKTGNSANSNHYKILEYAPQVVYDVPRLTDFAYILVGNVKHWDDQTAGKPSQMVKAIEFLQSRNVREWLPRSAY
ncbi:hypothetical protein [Sneathiella limimaris]|uniref:hypothetical protein n=1 Tax=Sneathiella limimaris TaxID=1964213 RepID=UPI00146EAAC2|nr:hypothetical protein [Sneathiella limimaris]